MPKETVPVVIEGEQRVTLCRHVHMLKEDFLAYEEICNSRFPRRDEDRKIRALAEKYGFDGGGDDQVSWDDPEDIAIYKMEDPNT